MHFTNFKFMLVQDQSSHYHNQNSFNDSVLCRLCLKKCKKKRILAILWKASFYM